MQFHEREIWWCALGVNVGSEQDGVAKTYEPPILVIKNFNGQVLWAVPLTRVRDAANLVSIISAISSPRMLGPA